MGGSFDFLHIKGRTAGSSNELSFDVLEHKSVEAEGKAARGSKAPKAPKASQGTYHGVSGSLAISGQAEIEKRKKARHSHRLRLQIAGVVAVLVVVAVCIYVGMSFHEDKTNIEGQVNALVERLSAVDETLVEVDGMMGDPLDAEQAERRSTAVAAMPQLTKELNRISVDAQTLSDLPVDDETEIVTGQLTKAAQARISMFKVASEAFSFSSEAGTQVSRANNIWNDVLRADQTAREAITAANKASTPEAAKAALGSTQEALSGFENALAELRDMSTAYGIDFTEQEAYLAKKIEALGYAVETTEGLLAGNREAAKAANEMYGEADASAAKLAEGLPPSIGNIVQTRFVRMMEAYQKRYEEARDRAVASDSVIREYINR